MGRVIDCIAVTVFLLFFSVIAKAQNVYFMPENNLHLQDGLFESNVTESQFNNIIALGERHYKPIIKKLGYELVIERNWDDATVNAYAYQNGTEMHVAMFGGLARRPEITEEGFALVLCHEIGHHLGGFPSYTMEGSKWAASEGNSDFYSTSSCARKILWGTALPDPNKDIEMYCSKAKDQFQCYSSFLGAMSLTRLLGTLTGEKASILKRDLKVVKRTNESYPSVQCRLDTYIAGALCDTKWDDSKIPQNRDEMRGISCDTRPRCWYNPFK